jgi:hypothetical protein
MFRKEWPIQLILLCWNEYFSPQKEKWERRNQND